MYYRSPDGRTRIVGVFRFYDKWVAGTLDGRRNEVSRLWGSGANYETRDQAQAVVDSWAQRHPWFIRVPSFTPPEQVFFRGAA